MTLVELLVTILIISILGALVLGVAAVAGETAREARSRNMIARIHTLLVEHMDTYKNRRVKVRQQVIDEINSQNGWNARRRREAIAAARLYALREMMLMEMPDRWSDVLLNQVPTSSAASATRLYPVYLDVSETGNGRSPLASVYLRRYDQVAQKAVSAEEVARLRENESAECLYLIITLATGDGEARTLFHESNIGDTDEDGAPEFLDGWGRPISFLRWAPGFDSEIQTNANELDLASDVNKAWIDAAAADHDPYDAYRVEPKAIRLLPLIYSDGRDESAGILPIQRDAVWTGVSNVTAPFDVALLNSPLRPYQWIAGNLYQGTADVDEKTATDNIHNHLIGER